MAKNKLINGSMDESIVSDEINEKKAMKEFVSFISIVTAISSAVAIIKSNVQFPWLESDMEEFAKNIVAIVLSFFSSFLVKLLINFVSDHRRKKWIKANSKVWVKGVWLHIHVKENGAIRVGYVEIQQYFNLIRAIGHNASLGDDGLNEKEWEYPVGKVFLEPSNGYNMKCIFTNQKGERVENTGTHFFKAVPGTDDFPIKLEGRFKDTINRDLKDSLKESINDEKALGRSLGEHYGTIFLFKPSKELLDKLTLKDRKLPDLSLIKKFVLDHRDGIEKGFEDECFTEGIDAAFEKSVKNSKLYQ